MKNGFNEHARLLFGYLQLPDHSRAQLAGRTRFGQDQKTSEIHRFFSVMSVDSTVNLEFS